MFVRTNIPFCRDDAHVSHVYNENVSNNHLLCSMLVGFAQQCTLWELGDSKNLRGCSLNGVGAKTCHSLPLDFQKILLPKNLGSASACFCSKLDRQRSLLMNITQWVFRHVLPVPGRAECPLPDTDGLTGCVKD